MKNQNKDIKKLIAGSIAAFAIVIAPVASANFGGDINAGATFDQKIEAKLNNENSNSIFKRINAAINSDTQANANVQARTNNDDDDSKDSKAKVKANFEQKLETKLNHPKSNSIFKRMASFFRNDNDDDKDGKKDGDVKAAVITDLKVSSIDPNRAVITWKTDVRANTSVWYGKTAGVNTSVDANAKIKARVLNHRIALKNLDANTQYFVVVGSVNKDGEVTKSAEISFTTPVTTTAPADTTAPVISNVRISAVSSTSATIAWNTNESSSSKIFFSKIFPIDLQASTTASATGDANVKNHSITLNNLSANTLYYFKLQSGDGSNNVNLTGTGAFMTSAQ